MTIDRIPITSRDQWLAARRQDITASVAGALFGVHPHVTPYGLHLFKSGMLSDDVEETPEMRRGRLFEDDAVQMISEDHPKLALEYPVGVYLRDPEHRIGATPDVLARDENGRLGVIQIKTVSPHVFRKKWRGDNGEIDPPLWIVIQAIIEATLTGAEWAAVAPMRAENGVEIDVIPIPLHAGIIDRLKYEVAEFWQRVERKEPPPVDYGRDGELLSRLYPQDNGLEVDLSGDNRILEFVATLERARADKKDADAREKTAKAGIQEKVGAARFARLPDGRRISNATIDRKGYQVAASSYRAIKILNGANTGGL